MDLVIPAYNNVDITFRLLASLRMFAPEAHVILVDNGSQDPIATLQTAVESMGGTYLRLDPNKGPYGAVNAGLALANNDQIGVICNDVVVLPNTLQILASICSSDNPYVGATGIVEPKFDYYNFLASASIGGRLARRFIHGGPYFSCFLAHRSLYERVGVYDERFKLTYGDTDHEQRIADTGIRMFCVSDALVYHGHGTGRKRGGVEADVNTDLRDYNAFVEKWQRRPDVLEKHPPESADFKKRFLNEVGWRVGEQ